MRGRRRLTKRRRVRLGRGQGVGRCCVTCGQPPHAVTLRNSETQEPLRFSYASTRSGGCIFRFHGTDSPITLYASCSVSGQPMPRAANATHWIAGVSRRFHPSTKVSGSSSWPQEDYESSRNPQREVRRQMRSVVLVAVALLGCARCPSAPTRPSGAGLGWPALASAARTRWVAPPCPHALTPRSPAGAGARMPLPRPPRRPSRLYRRA